MIIGERNVEMIQLLIKSVLYLLACIYLARLCTTTFDRMINQKGRKRDQSSSSTSLCSQSPTTPRREDTHNPKDNVKQSQRIRHQTPHSSHLSNDTEHSRGAIRAPTNRSSRQQIPKHRIHGDHNANETSQNQRQETISQDAG